MVADIGPLPAYEVNFDDIEACGDVISPEQGKPVMQTSAQQFALVAVDCAHGGSTGGGGTAFHLAGNQHIALAAHDVQLTAVTVAEITAKYLTTFCSQVRGCHQLAILTQLGS